MKKLLIIILWSFSIKQASAQEGKQVNVSLTVKDNLGKPVEGASVSLFKTKDSTLFRTSITESTGTAFFENIASGKYYGAVSHIGFMTGTIAVFEIPQDQSSITLPAVALQPRSNTDLKSVTVTSKKPFIQKLSDRIVVNVEGSIMSTGSSAMEVLERSPGVIVDQNDIISLRGKQGVLIMIDGKPTAMSGADLANYLKGLPSSAIELIDIITNPSAKYDAAGNAGIIDIRMKKDRRLGSNGSFNASYGQGVYPKAGSGITFNYRNKKLNFFGNHNYAYRVGLNHLILDRNFYENGQYNGGDLKDNYSKSPFSTHTSRIGMDFFPSKKTIIGFVVNSNFGHYRRNNDNSSIVISPAKERESTFLSRAKNNDHSNNIVANLNFKHSFDSSGKEISADLDYGIYHSRSLTLNATSYYKLDGTLLQPDYILDGNQKGKLRFATGKADFTAPMKHKFLLEAGAKTSYVSSDNDARFTDVSNQVPQNDSNKTNHFLYKEYNNAAYLNLKKEFKKFDLQIGLRGEHTSISTQQLIGNKTFDSSYFQLFPSAFFNYHLKENKTIGLSMSRRIDRPGYSQLNPFLFLIDVTTYSTGKPGLLPQLTWLYELSYTVNNMNFSVGYSYTKDNQNIAIAKFKDVFPNIPSADNVTVQIPVNLRSSQNYSFSATLPFKINRWWSTVNNADIYYEKFNGTLGTTRLNNGKAVADIRSSHNFTFSKGWSAEFNANFNSGGRYGFMLMDPQWGIGIGAQKMILKNKGTLRFNFTDIFWTNLPKAVITYDNYIEKWNAYRETRVATLSFAYRFGNNKVQAARRRTTGSEEERRRAQ